MFYHKDLFYNSTLSHSSSKLIGVSLWLSLTLDEPEVNAFNLHGSIYNEIVSNWLRLSGFRVFYVHHCVTF